VHINNSVITRVACYDLFNFFTVQMSNGTAIVCTSALLFRRGQPHSRLAFEITQSKCYFHILKLYIYNFILWNIILITLQVLGFIIMIYVFNLSWVGVGSARALIRHVYTSRHWVGFKYFKSWYLKIILKYT